MERVGVRGGGGGAGEGGEVRGGSLECSSEEERCGDVVER